LGKRGVLTSILAVFFISLVSILAYLYIVETPKQFKITKISDFDISEDEETDVKGTSDEEEKSPDIIPDYPKPEVIPDSDNDSGLEVSAWIANWATADGITTFNENKVLTSVSPTWYYLRPDGTLGLKEGARSTSLVSTVHNRNATIIPSISNPSASELHNILSSTNLKAKLISNITLEVEKHEYDGIDIDFEVIDTDDSELFTSFIKDLSESLHNKNKKITIAVLPKTEEFIYTLSEARNAQDWPEISKYVDEFRIMGYDFEHNSTSSAGPISSVTWLEEVLTYAVKKVPRNKIVLGLPLYGYHWIKGGKTTSLTWKTEQSLEGQFGEKGVLDSISKEKVLRSGDSEIWYQDSESMRYRIELIKKYKIKGVVFWRLGREDDRIWSLFE
jgi:spore germination protein